MFRNKRLRVFPSSLLFLLCCFLLSVSAAANIADSPQKLVEDTTSKILATLKAEKNAVKKAPDRLYTLVDEIVLPHFDFELMAKRVLGKYWRQASDTQKVQFTGAFRGLLVRTYANSLTEYTDQAINYLPMRSDKDNQKVEVRSEVESPGKGPIQINYRLLDAGEEWKVYDVTINGVSLVTNYRSSFVNEIDRGGLDALISKIDSRNKGQSE